MSAKPKRLPNEQDAEAYISDMSSALAELARQHRLATLGYLLELAQVEAERGRARQGAGARRRAAAQRSPRSADQSRDNRPTAGNSRTAGEPADPAPPACGKYLFRARERR
jgi:hypothetical protein